jgi:hypothetical protein
MKLTDVTSEIRKVEIHIADDDETTTVVLTNEHGTFKVTGRLEITEGQKPGAPSPI